MHQHSTRHTTRRHAIGALGLAIVAAGLLGTAATARADAVYNNPQVYGLAVDNCAVWGTQCGWGGAHLFCQTQGYQGARGWQLNRPGRTYVIGANRVCEGGSCVGFSQVVCASAATPTPAVTPAATPAQPPVAQAGYVNVAGRWSWSVNCPEANGGLFDIGPIAPDGSFSGAFPNGNGSLQGRVQGNRIAFTRIWGGIYQQQWIATVSGNRMEQGIVQRPTERKGNCSFAAARSA